MLNKEQKIIMIDLSSFNWGWLSGHSKQAKFHKNGMIKEIFEDTQLGKFPVGMKLGKNYGKLREFSW